MSPACDTTRSAVLLRRPKSDLGKLVEIERLAASTAKGMIQDDEDKSEKEA